MANWKNTVKIGDLHEAYRTGKMPIAEMAACVAVRFKDLARRHPDLEDVVAGFLEVEDADDYDDVLEVLYAWGDRDHRLWIDTVDRQDP